MLELIVVMAILSALFGIGVGAFRSFSRPERTAANQIKDTMRVARLFARSEGVPASVVVRPADNVVFAVGLRTVGNWHFEDMAGTGWPVDASHPDGELVASPVLGTALVLRERAQLDISSPPASFDSAHGLGVDFYVQPDIEGRPMTLLERPGSWRLELDEDDELRVVLMLEATVAAGLEDVEGADGTEEFRHGVPAARLSPHRASRLTVVFDGRALRVAVDGARVEADTLFREPRRLVLSPRVTLGTGREPHQFRGLIDELRIASVVKDEPQLLPHEVVLDGEEQVLHVDAFGHLDPAWHRTPVRVGIVFGDPPRRTVVEFGLLGTVRSWEEDTGPVVADTGAEETP